MVVGDGVDVWTRRIQHAFNFQRGIDRAISREHIALKITFTQSLNGDVFKTVTPLVTPKCLSAGQSGCQVSQQAQSNAIAGQNTIAVDQILFQLF